MIGADCAALSAVVIPVQYLLFLHHPYLDPELICVFYRFDFYFFNELNIWQLTDLDQKIL
jgi:hypothetical protein